VQTTGSQSKSSIGYSAAAKMHSTANSGIVATETRFRANGPAMLAMLDTFHLGRKEQTPPVHGTWIGTQINRMSLGDPGNRQYFSSRLTKTLTGPGNTINRASFEIESGLDAGGRKLGGAFAFFEVDNVKIGNPTVWPGTNALYVGENANLKTGDHRMTVRGHATLKAPRSNPPNPNNDYINFQPESGQRIEFLPDVERDVNGDTIRNLDGTPKMSGNVYFDGDVKFQTNAPNIQVNAFFNGNVEFSGSENISFNRKIGINGNFSALNKTANFSDSAWINGSFVALNQSQIDNTRLGLTNTGRLFYGDNLPLRGTLGTSCNIITWTENQVQRTQCTNQGSNHLNNRNPLPCNSGETCMATHRIGACVYTVQWTAYENNPPNNWNSNCQHGNAHLNTTNNFANYNTISNRIEHFLPPETSDYATYIREQVKVSPPAQRTEPNVDIFANIPLQSDQGGNQNVSAADGGKRFLDVGNTNGVQVFNSNGTVNLNSLAKVEDIKSRGITLGPSGSESALNGDRLQTLYAAVKDNDNWKEFFEKGQLLLRVPQGRTINAAGGTFNGNVILNLQGQLDASPEQPFFNSTEPSASTLIHVNGSGNFNNFTVAPTKTFQGLIYVDQNNTKQSTFKWAEDTNVEGAIILKGGTYNWNHANNGHVTIRRNPRVLSNYGYLTGSSTPPKLEFAVPGNDSIRLHPVGIYFR